MSNNLEQYKQESRDLNWQEKLEYIAKFPDVVFSSSFSIEDQLISSYILAKNLDIEIFTLDTGRLFPETYEVWAATEKKYAQKIKAYYPQTDKIEEYVKTNGIDAFYASKELRLECCHIRKVEPLNRALAGKKIWLSGIRKAHSNSRSDKEFFEYDAALDIIKFYPILELNEDEIIAQLKQDEVPFNQLHFQGFKSIGCKPCTRAINDGDDFRAGRWWWETDEKKECGLHIVNGKLQRIKS